MVLQCEQKAGLKRSALLHFFGARAVGHGHNEIILSITPIASNANDSAAARPCTQDRRATRPCAHKKQKAVSIRTLTVYYQHNVNHCNPRNMKDGVAALPCTRATAVCHRKQKAQDCGCQRGLKVSMLAYNSVTLQLVSMMVAAVQQSARLMQMASIIDAAHLNGPALCCTTLQVSARRMQTWSEVQQLRCLAGLDRVLIQQ